MKNKILKNNQKVRFALILLIIMVFSFSIHANINVNLFKSLYANSIILTYSVNYFITVIVFWLLIKYLDKVENTLGFYFMGASLFKFLIFFLVFQPIFKENGSTDKAEFISFFIPYSLSLALEVYFLVNILNKPNRINQSEASK